MSKVIALVSKSTRLLISLHNDDSGFSISEDHITLSFARKELISNISMHLSSERKKMHTFDFPCNRNGRMNSVRVDAIFPLVFGDLETINYVLNGIPDQLSPFDGQTFNLEVELNFGDVLQQPIVSKINSVSLNVDSATVHCSKEVLGASSDFFSTLFYGDFVEKNSGSYSVKEVDEKSFTWLINSLMERKWNLTSVEQALSVLSLADRFCIQNVHKRIIPYIKSIQLTRPTRVESLTRYLPLAIKCGDDGEFVRWIFERCQSATELTQVAQSCGAALNPHLHTFFMILATHQHDEKTKNAGTMDALVKEIARLAKENRDLKPCVLPSEEERESDNLVVLPASATFRASGGISYHILVNSGDSKIMFNVRATNNDEYSVCPPYGFIEAGASSKPQMEVIRSDGPPKEDKYFIDFAPALEGATNAREAFESTTPYGTLTLLLKAE